MSLRDRAQEVRARSDSHRRKIKVGGYPARAVRWWEEQTGTYRMPNLCNTTWTAVLWAPLLALRLFAKRLWSSPLTKLIVVALAIIGYVYACVVFRDVLVVSLSVVVGVVSLAGAVFTAALLDYKVDDNTGPTYYYAREHRTIAALAIIVGFVGSIIAVAGFGIIYVLVRIVDSNAWDWLKYGRIRGLGDTSPRMLIAALLIAALVLFEGIVMSEWTPLIVVCIIATAAALFGSALMGISVLDERLNHRKAVKRSARQIKRDQLVEERRKALYPLYEQKIEPVLRIRFAQLHPKHRDDEARYQKWRDRFVRHARKVDGPGWAYSCVYNGGGVITNFVDGADYYTLWSALGVLQDEMISSGDVSYDIEIPPSRLAAIGSGLWELVVLIGSYLRAAKLKLCPLVEFE